MVWTPAALWANQTTHACSLTKHCLANVKALSEFAAESSLPISGEQSAMKPSWLGVLDRPHDCTPVRQHKAVQIQGCQQRLCRAWKFSTVTLKGVRAFTCLLSGLDLPGQIGNSPACW